jgi:hypothetical protein
MASAIDGRGGPEFAARRAAMADVLALLSSRRDGGALAVPLARRHWSVALDQSPLLADRGGEDSPNAGTMMQA